MMNILLGFYQKIFKFGMDFFVVCRLVFSKVETHICLSSSISRLLTHIFAPSPSPSPFIPQTQLCSQIIMACTSNLNFVFFSLNFRFLTFNFRFFHIQLFVPHIRLFVFHIQLRIFNIQLLFSSRLIFCFSHSAFCFSHSAFCLSYPVYKSKFFGAAHINSFNFFYRSFTRLPTSTRPQRHRFRSYHRFGSKQQHQKNRLISHAE